MHLTKYGLWARNAAKKNIKNKRRYNFWMSALAFSPERWILKRE